MADSTIVDVDPCSPVDFNSDNFPSPPLDDLFFSIGGGGNDVVPLEDLDFFFSFDDDLEIPPPDNVDELTGQGRIGLEPQSDQFRGVFKSSAPELRHADKKCDLSQKSWDGSGVSSSHADSVQVSDYLNVDSPANVENPGGGVKGLNCPSPDTQGSGHYVSNVSEESNNCAVSSSNINCSAVDLKVERELISDSNYTENLSIDGSNKCALKRKNEDIDLKRSIISSKYRKSNNGDEGKSSCNNDDNDCLLSEEDERRKARLMRNRESAQLSRQRKKHYVEELEDKVRSMHSTIQDLHSKISFFMAENATLRQQMCSGGDASGNASGAKVVPSTVVPPPPGMYPHHPMMYPWMACPPPYMVKPQGSQVPLVPIPRLKPQPTTHASKPTKKETSKKVNSKKNEGPRMKKVAGVSLLGLLFFLMLVIGLVPMVNQRYGGFKEALVGEGSYSSGGFYREHHGRVLMANGTDSSGGRNLSSGRKGHSGRGELSADEFVRLGNGSEPLAASLYVPRNDKLVKIDGNLIIHSIMASEKAMASSESGAEETGLVPVAGHPHLMARGSGSGTKEHGSTTNDGKLHQWFSEGLAAPMLNTGMCTKVFEFDVSAASSSGAIIQATTASTNTSEQHSKKNSTQLSKTRNRRILHGLPMPVPIPESTHNISSADSSGQKEDLKGNSKNSSSSSSSSMVVSVLFDPRETGDSDVDGVMGKQSLSRIFVVVLIDSVKYVTYSCMLPFMASAPLVTT